MKHSYTEQFFIAYLKSKFKFNSICFFPSILAKPTSQHTSFTFYYSRYSMKTGTMCGLVNASVPVPTKCVYE